MQNAKLKSSKWSIAKKDFLRTFLFGILSATLGMIQLETPGYEGSYSDLREIALISSLFHIGNPLYIIPLCLLTLIGLPIEPRLFAVFTTHVIPLIIIWFIYKKSVENKNFTTVRVGIMWSIIVVFYYVALLYPILIITYKWVGINTNLDFMVSYKLIFDSGKFEMIATALISSMYLIQLNIRRYLEHTNKNLENVVDKRTHQLSDANQKLNELNKTLEKRITERTEKINMQLAQITEYAHMNAHEVRGPLARILGLMGLIKKEKSEVERESLLKKLEDSSEELDAIVKKMNRLLENDV